MDGRINNAIQWQEYLTRHNFGGSLWTEFQKKNRKKQNETYNEYVKRLSDEYMKSKYIKEPVTGKFDDIIERLDIIISKLDNRIALPPAPPMNLPPLPQKREQEKVIIIPKNTKFIDDTNEPIQVKLLNELKRKLAERENKGNGIGIVNNPLSNIDVQNKVGCKFILYENMHKVNNINELLPMTLILYQLANVGHFCCVFRNKEGINFFDPLGFKPDDELKLSNDYAPNHKFTYLIKLLSNTNEQIIYNEYKLQASGTSTCGHWCTVRMSSINLTCDEFADCFRGVKNRDEIIVKIFNSI